MIETRNFVTQAILERIKSNSRPCKRDDDKKIALIIQGGAMRGVIGGGMVMAMEKLMGGSNPFDVMYGTSSGAYAEVYLQARQTGLGTSIYYEELAGKNFIDPKNFLRGRPVVHMSAVGNAIRRGKKRLDAQRIVDSPVPIHIYAASVKDGSSYDFYPFESCEDVYTALDATGCIPYLSGQVVAYKEGVYIDGAVSDAGRVPLQKAIDDGCSDILVCLTEKDKSSNYPLPLIERWIQFRLRKRFPELARNYWNGHNTHRYTLDLLREAEDGLLSYPKIEVVKVKDERLTPRSWETRPDRLKLAARAGYDALMTRIRVDY